MAVVSGQALFFCFCIFPNTFFSPFLPSHGPKLVLPIWHNQVQDMVLHTGKYLNVIRECGRDITFPDAELLTYSLRERNYTRIIEHAYTFASRAVLDLLMNEMQLMPRLR